MKPSLGRIVQYVLTEEDATAINKRRSDFQHLGREKLKDDTWSFGAQAHVGNPVKAGDIFPMIITRLWPDASGTPASYVNGQVLLDGTDAYWVTSRQPAEEPKEGHWSWPARVAALLAVLLSALVPSSAFAQDAAPTPASSGVLGFVVQYVLPPLVPLLGALVTWALAKLVAFLDAKAKESKAALVAAKLTGAAQSVVAELNATLRPQLEAALADGALTDAEKKQLKDAALNTLKTKLPTSLMASASSIFGGFLDTYLSGAIERAVLDQKATAAIGASRPPTP